MNRIFNNKHYKSDFILLGEKHCRICIFINNIYIYFTGNYLIYGYSYVHITIATLLYKKSTQPIFLQLYFFQLLNTHTKYTSYLIK